MRPSSFGSFGFLVSKNQCGELGGLLICRGGELEEFAANYGHHGLRFWLVLFGNVELDDAGHGTSLPFFSEPLLLLRSSLLGSASLDDVEPGKYRHS